MWFLCKPIRLSNVDSDVPGVTGAPEWFSVRDEQKNKTLRFNYSSGNEVQRGRPRPTHSAWAWIVCNSLIIVEHVSLKTGILYPSIS